MAFPSVQDRARIVFDCQTANDPASMSLAISSRLRACARVIIEPIMKEWVTNVVAIVELPVLGWIAYQLYEMHPKVDETAHRVDRIVEVLPEVRTHIVQEDMKKIVRVALVTKEPVRSLTGQWSQELDLIDFASGKKVTFGVPTKGQDDLSASYLIAGLAERISRDKISFADYTAAAAEIGKPAAAYPDFVNAWSSFAIIKPRPRYYSDIIKVFGPPVREKNILKQQIALEKLIDELIAKKIIQEGDDTRK
jgi:hypothetical protein